ncbi:hypothetical protein HMPREF0591_5465 [Mycobacterium parascrofulaceum ATCC BAA-614]|uniref:Uncharacterized protein n=1 Tax=Mycobacterium parascrofulaceum ATCC BAA-614 TaxID=525368 RepID=D5PH21_9MYCO|nr:hypothetical protein HMPREF0591_5465 [Mycobacterium parascrofulaceum ATCC BAA-614]
MKRRRRRVRRRVVGIPALIPVLVLSPGRVPRLVRAPMHLGRGSGLGVGGARDHSESGRGEAAGEESAGDDAGKGVGDRHAVCPLFMRQVGWRLRSKQTTFARLPIPTC